MPPGSEPLIVVLRDQIIAEIETIDHDAEGYWFNYGKVQKGVAWFSKDEDPNRPVPYLQWSGALGGPDDPRGGQEQGYQRFRRFEAFDLTFAVVDLEGDHDRKAWRIEADMHHRLLDASRRRLGHTALINRGRPLLSYLPPLWFPGVFGEDGPGGFLQLTLGLQWDHVSGDMSVGG